MPPTIITVYYHETKIDEPTGRYFARMPTMTMPIDAERWAYMPFIQLTLMPTWAHLRALLRPEELRHDEIRYIDYAGQSASTIILLQKPRRVPAISYRYSQRENIFTSHITASVMRWITAIDIAESIFAAS